MEKQFVIFELSGEHFGIEIAAVESIVKMQKITRIPHAPDYVEGIMNLRGMVLPVVDLEKRFGMPAHKQAAGTRIVVANMGNVKIGMIVAGVSEVLNIEDSAIEATPPIVTSVNTRFITGVAKIDSRLIILLDLTCVLTTEEMEETTLLAQV